MNSGPPQRSVKEIASAHPEVEFALVLARTIDSATNDPEQLRSAIYELARQKLQQLTHDDPAEKARLMQALEVAIAGVEAHTKHTTIGKIPTASTGAYLPPLRSNAIGPPANSDRAMAQESIGRKAPVEVTVSRPQRDDGGRNALRWSSSTALRFTTLLAILAAIVALLVLQQRGFTIASLRNIGLPSWSMPRLASSTKDEPISPPQGTTAPQATAAQAEPKKSPSLLPTAYGVYAESAGKLYELEMLQGRAPDPRVAISAAIAKPSKTVLPDGHLRFIVFRADAAGGASDLIEVRVIAQVKQATTFDSAGKPVVAPSDDTWVIRNISFPYRAAPLKEDPQMFQIEARDPDAVLGPGRYALVLKGQAFDFTVEGTITDKRQCLERLAAANGNFYSECQKP